MNCDQTIDALGMRPVYDPAQDRCPVDWSRRLLLALRRTACGHGVFCRDAGRQLLSIVTAVANGQSNPADLELLKEICEATALLGCTLSAAVGRGIADTLSDPVWEDHIRRRRCAAGLCTGLLTPYIDPALCTGCGACKTACPSRAITGSEGMIHILDARLCRSRGQCEAVCPANAIRRAEKLPRLPEQPIPVGSFRAAAPAGKGLGKGLKKGLKKN